MSIVVAGVSDQLVTCDLYCALGPGQKKGTGRVRIGVPEGTVPELIVDEDEHAWVRADAVAERTDGHVEVNVVVEAPESYPLACYARWGENQVTRRGPSETPIWIELDGLPTPAGTGLLSPNFGGPEKVAGWQRSDGS